jgi:acetylornithine deacetylase
VLARSHRSAIGKPLESFMSGAYLDARVYALYDKVPTLCYGPIGRGIHGVDECDSLSSVQRITGAMTLFIAEWCGVEPLQG